MLISVIRENEIFIYVIRDPVFFPFVNRAREPMYDPQTIEWNIFALTPKRTYINIHFLLAISPQNQDSGSEKKYF